MGGSSGQQQQQQSAVAAAVSVNANGALDQLLLTFIQGRMQSSALERPRAHKGREAFVTPHCGVSTERREGGTRHESAPAETCHDTILTVVSTP